MNSSVQMQWCNFRLPTPFPNKTPVIWFLLEGWLYGVIYSIRSAWEGAARAQPQGHRQPPHVGKQYPSHGLISLQFCYFPCFSTQKNPHLAHQCANTQPLCHYYGEGAPAQWWCLAIFSTYRINPLVSITENHQIQSQLGDAKAKNVWTSSIFPSPQLLPCKASSYWCSFHSSTIYSTYMYIIYNFIER